MNIDVGALAMWHSEKAPAWGRVVGADAEHVYAEKRGLGAGYVVAVKREDVFGVADTVATLSDAYAEHVPACALCEERRQRFLRQLEGLVEWP